MSAIKNKLKILFFHNTLPEYRIGWFQSLAKHADVVFVFTKYSLQGTTQGRYLTGGVPPVRFSM